jgi:hypothetical protein
MDEKDKPGEENTDDGKKLVNAPTMTGGKTLSATPSLVEQQYQPGRPILSVSIGERFGDYQILRLLGKGGMGEVYEADHLESGRRVALKVLSQSLGSPEDRARFLQEGKLAAQVSHPNCVFVYGTEEIQGVPVISMELAPGGTLKDLVRAKGRLSPEKAVDAILQVVSGLEAAHSTGVLHRDIKPSNCFVDTEGNTKIGDFGLSISTLARAERDVTASGSFVGTPAFASPEQLRGENLDVHSDIYSVGATLYYLLTGNVPFDETNLMKLVSRILEKTAESPRSLYKNIPKGLAGIVMRCLEKKPSARFSNYSDLKKALRPFSSAAMAPASLGLRFNAAFLDILTLLFFFSLVGIQRSLWSILEQESLPIIAAFLFLLYFTVLEGIWGRTGGKAFRKIRVVGPDRDLPGIPRIMLRTLIFVLPVLVVGWFVARQLHNILPEARNLISQVIISVISYCVYVALIGLLFITARRGNGFAGIHDLVSNTRVISVLPVKDESVELSAETILVPETKHYIGPYLELESLRKSTHDELILGYDEKLRRKMWIHVLAAGAPALPDSRRDVTRQGRLRWVNGKRTPEISWDAYEALEGSAFLHYISKRNSWILVRRWLIEIIEEIETGLKDRSLLSSVGLDRIWITPKRRAKLLDFPAPGLDPGMKLPESGETAEDVTSMRSIRIFLKQMALSALEGIPRGFDDARMGMPSVPLPLQVRTLMKTLHTEKDASLEDLARLLRSWIDKEDITPITRKFRQTRLGAVVYYLCMMSLLTMMWLPDPFWRAAPEQSLRSLIVLGYVGILGSLSALVCRGGMLLRGQGAAVVSRNGTPVSRPRTFVRGLVGWSPMILLGLLPSVWNRAWIISPLAVKRTVGLSFPLWPSLFLLAVSIAGCIWSIVTPERGPHDRIVGTYLVPR